MNGFVLHPGAYTDLDDCVGRTLLSAAVDAEFLFLDACPWVAQRFHRCGKRIALNSALAAEGRASYSLAIN
jgi:hypothetical protein